MLTLFVLLQVRLFQTLTAIRFLKFEAIQMGHVFHALLLCRSFQDAIAIDHYDHWYAFPGDPTDVWFAVNIYP